MAGVLSPELRPSSLKHRALRRTRSIRSLSRQHDSFDSRDLDQDSIFNAEKVHSNESLPSNEQGELAKDASEAHGSSTLSLSPRSPLGDSSNPHSHWPPPHLGSILEKNSINSIRPFGSLPRLAPSPERMSRIINPQQSIHSIHPKTSASPWSLQKAPPSAYLSHRRSLSMNDLDLISQPPVPPASPRHSSSSGNDIDRRNWCPTLPNKPVQSPPHRVPTPPGLPSFGTEEANEYRLSGQQSPGRSLWNRLWRHSPEASDEQRAISPRLLGSPLLRPPSPPSPHVGPPGEIFKRTLAMLGMARVVSPPPPSLHPGRVSLPPGVVTSNNGSGALVQADDGTFIRGRFGPRASGHGVGGRSLEAHPIARTAQLSAIEEQVREIDKACERADIENTLSQGPIDETRHGLNSSVPSHDEPRQTAMTQRTEAAAQPRFSEDNLSSPAIYLSPPSVSPPTAVRSIRDDSGLSTHGRPHSDSARLRSPPMLPHHSMRQGPGYTPSTLLSLRSMDSMPGIFSSAEEAERTRVRELVLEEKRKEQRKVWVQLWCAAEDCCHNIWHLWARTSSCGGDHGCRRSESE